MTSRLACNVLARPGRSKTFMQHAVTQMKSNQAKWRLIVVAGGLLTCAVVPAAWGTAASASIVTPATTPSPAAQTPKSRFRFKGPVCECGFGVTEQEIEAAQLKREQTGRSAKTTVNDHQSERGKEK